MTQCPAYQAEIEPSKREVDATLRRGVLQEQDALAEAIANKIGSANATANVNVVERAALTPAVFDAWLSSIDGTTDERTRKEYGRIARVQWMPQFGTFASLDGASGTRNAKAYTSARLKSVSKSMHKKELSALRGFVAWAQEHEYIADAPHVPPPPRKATGKHSETRKVAPVSVSEEEIVSASSDNCPSGRGRVEEKIGIGCATCSCSRGRRGFARLRSGD